MRAKCVGYTTKNVTGDLAPDAYRKVILVKNLSSRNR